jgi:hypothetical protein
MISNLNNDKILIIYNNGNLCVKTVWMKRANAHNVTTTAIIQPAPPVDIQYSLTAARDLSGTSMIWISV